MSTEAPVKTRLKTSAMIASIAAEGQRTVSAPFGHALAKLAETRPEIVGMSADLAKYTDLHIFAAAHPDRFYQMGMAEQLLMMAGAGMAREGFQPWLTTYAVFASRRAYDFLCLAIAEEGLDVKVCCALLGARTWLEDKGIKPTITYIWFPVLNVNGGTKSKARQSGQLAAGVAFDMNKIAGIEGGTVQVTISNRNGVNINDANHLGLLQYPQGVFGAGEIWRLADVYWKQQIGPVELKAGHMSMGEDFGSTTCFFESLYFCGVVPGHTSFNYWYNYPVGTWGARAKVTDRLGYTMVGVYQRNDQTFPINKGFYLGWKAGNGAMVAIERGFTTKLGGDPKRAGLYKIGVFFDTSRSDDLVYDVNGGFHAITGLPLRRERGRASFYAMGRQQIIAADDEGAHGLAAFFNYVQADHRTNKLINVITAGVTYSGILPERPKDEIGLAVGRSRVNGHVADLEEAQNVTAVDPSEPQHNEYAIEATYSIAVTPGLSVRPNVQWYLDPGGRGSTRTITVLGTGVFLTL